MNYPIIPPKTANALRVVSVNVNGLRAAAKKGFFEWLCAFDADVVCLQETRLTHAQWVDTLRPQGFYTALFCAQKAGYAGTAIYSRLPFVAQIGLGFDIADDEGRFLAGEFDLLGKKVYICSLYLPSGSSSELAQAKKDAFLMQYKDILHTWRKQNRSVIICGDYNIVHQKRDIKNWSGNQKASGCLPHERAWLDEIYQMGYVDSFRKVRIDESVYSWWSNRGQARANNVGWRIDYQVVSPDWGERVLGAWVYREQFFSDHAPVVIDYALK